LFHSSTVEELLKIYCFVLERMIEWEEVRGEVGEKEREEI
jgi:hypothetical protein